MATADEYAQWIVSNADKKGTHEFDIVAQAYAEAKQEAPVVKAGAELNDVGRQVGLSARYGLEGLANTAQIATEPIRYITDRLTGNVGKTKPLGSLASDAADWIGLPKPQGSTERVVGDATRLLAGTGLSLGAGQIAQRGAGVVKSIGDMFSQAPSLQLASAAGAGLGGGASREAGGSPLQQTTSAIIGGLAGAGAVGAGNAIAQKATGLKNALMLSNNDIDVKIGSVLKQSGVDYSKVPERIRQSMREELKAALNTEQDLNPAAVARLLDFKSNNLTPTRGMLSLDPVQITREQNLAKIASNGSDGQLHPLPRIQNQNNAQLITNLNQAGAQQGSASAAGDLVTSSVLGRQAGLRGVEKDAWSAAKNSPGYTQPISSSAISDINSALGDEGLMPFMNPTISRYMEAFQTGQPFTPQAYRNLQSMLAREVAKGGNEGAAASLAQRVLVKADLRPAGFDGAGLVTPGMAQGIRTADTAATDSIDAVNAARGATKRAYAYEDSSPLVRSVLSEGATSDPQRIAQRYVIGGTAREAADMAKQVGPQGREVIKNALVNHLKSKAINDAADEVGKFSQSAFNKELRALKESGKLSLFFSKDEVSQLESMGRAASYMQVQPVGSAVNNSNSGALLIGKGMDWLKSVPVVGPMTSPSLENIAINFRQKQATKLAKGLLADNQIQARLGSVLSPGVALGGLLAAP